MQQLISLWHALALKHLANADIELQEVIESHISSNGSRSEVFHNVLLLDALKLLHLSVDYRVFHLLEEQFGLLDVAAGSENVDRAKFAPVGSGEIEHLAQLLGRERQERLEGNSQIGSDLQSHIHYGSHTLHVGLGELPWLGVGEILVADTGEVHSVLQSLTEVELLDVGIERVFHAVKFLDSGAVIVGEFTGSRNHAVEVFVGEHERAVHEVAENRYQLIVVASLEIAPREVVILGFGSIGSEHIAQHILLAGEIHKILMQPHRPVARGGNLVALKVEEFVGRHVVGHDIFAVCLHHSGENEAVEHDIVLADEVNEASVFVLPPLLPVAPLLGIGIAKLLGVADVADRRVKPHIEHLAIGTLNGYWNTPVEVARHSTGLEVHVEPRLALSVNIGAPLLVTLKNPLFEPVLILVERQIPVFS